MNKRIVGKIKTNKTFCIEWSIPDFLSLTNEATSDDGYISTTFKCLEDEWHFQMNPVDHTGGGIGVYLNKKGNTGALFIQLSVGLMSSAGKKRHEKIFVGNIDHTTGFPEFLRKSELVNEKTSLLPCGVLILICAVRLNNPCNVSRTDKLSTDFQTMLTAGMNTDVTAKVEDEEFKLHKAVLCARTSYFAAMFAHEMTENSTSIVTINDCKADTFRLFVRYLYTGRVILSPENVFHLFKLADMYQVEELKDACLRCIMNTMSVTTFCDAVSLAMQHENKDLLEKATKFLSTSMEDIMETDKWEKFLVENAVRGNKLLLDALKLKKQDPMELESSIDVHSSDE